MDDTLNQMDAKKKELRNSLVGFIEDSGIVSYGANFDPNEVDWCTFLPGGYVHGLVCALEGGFGGKLPTYGRLASGERIPILRFWCDVGRFARLAEQLMPDPGVGHPTHDKLYKLHSRMTDRLEQLVKWLSDAPAENENVSENRVTNGHEPLSERAQDVLVAMLELDAFDSDRRKPTDEIATKAFGENADANALKNVMSDLKTRKLINSKTGRGGGCWLTENGFVRATKIRDL